MSVSNIFKAKILNILNNKNSERILMGFHTSCCKRNKAESENEKEYLQTKPRKHCYKTLYNWKSKEELAKDLASNVIYNKDGIICLNKPYGLRIHPLKEKLITEKKQIIETLHASAAEDIPYSLQCCKEELLNILNYQTLILTKTTERYSSGIVMYAESEKKKVMINKAFVRSKDLKRPPFKYLALVLGCPPEPSCEERIGITLTDVKEKTDETLPVIVNTFSKTQMKKQLVKPATVHYKILGTNEMKSASLLEISTTCRKWHFLQVYSSHKGMPIVGDNLYGSRVQWVMGKPVTINIATASNMQMNYPSSILHCLELSDKIKSIIPVHLHLHQIKLNINKNDVIFTAPLPEFFQWTLRKLGLSHCI